MNFGIVEYIVAVLEVITHEDKNVEGLFYCFIAKADLGHNKGVDVGPAGNTYFKYGRSSTSITFSISPDAKLP